MGSAPSPSMQRSPHDQAVDFYNNAERRIDGLTKMHDEMKAAATTDPQKAAKLQAKLAKGLENAAADLERAVKNDPSLFQAYSELGFTYRKMGRYKESLEAYDKALSLSPDYTPALEYRAEAYLGLNRLEDARTTYTELFSGDRTKADALLMAMKSFVAARRADAAGLDPAKLDEFAKWVDQRDIIHRPDSRVDRANIHVPLVVKLRLIVAAATLVAAAACSGNDAPAAAPFVWNLPAGFPLPLTAADNIQTEAKFALGRRLFYDRRLSANGTQACSDCHQQSRAFSDGKLVAVGSTGQPHTRNAPTLTNAGYNASYTWDSVAVRSLERQALVPMFNTHPIELGVKGHEEEIVARFRGDEASFRAAFPGERQPVTIRNITKALAAFERALISGNSPYDRLVYGGDPNALSPAAWRGMRLFFTARAGCSACHQGFNFSGESRYAGHSKPTPVLVRNGVTEGAFRVPTLRNIELTAPYMHDGSIATLDEVIERYVAARKLTLSANDRADLAEFLRSLTDRQFVTDARLAAP
jgi:cytochrome c peroxidase